MGFVKIKTAKVAKSIVTLFTGVLFLAISVFLLTPNSSEIIADLLKLQSAIQTI